MSCGVISYQLNLQKLKQPDTNNQFRTRRRSTTRNEVCFFCVSFKTPHHNNNNLLIENQKVFRSKSGCYYRLLFRTKAATSSSSSSSSSSTIKDNDNLEDLSENNDSSSFYQLLGISESGSFSEIKQAYKQLARKYHPDVSPPDRAEEYTKRFIQVQEAYEILSDPNRRAMYDRDLARGLLHLAAAFSARKRSSSSYYHHYDHQEGVDERSNWKNCWQTQLSGLKKKSINRDSSNDNMSWGARMRRQRNEHSSGESSYDDNTSV